MGAGVSLWASQFVATLMYDLEPRDPVTLGAAAVTLVAIGAVLGWLPAWRASRIDPVDVLREGVDPRMRVSFVKTLCGAMFQPCRALGSGDKGPGPLKFQAQKCRGVAQPGRASGSGPEGRWFESSRPDQNFGVSPESCLAERNIRQNQSRREEQSIQQVRGTARFRRNRLRPAFILSLEISGR